MDNNLNLPGNTSIGGVHLLVKDLDMSANFYTGLLGFQIIQQQGKEMRLSASGDPPAQISLTASPTARHKPPNTTGLFHYAILFPNRQELGKTLSRLIKNDWTILGSADHLVSEAIYLTDPDGLGIEIYSDRPREKWPWSGDQIEMSTQRLDLHDLLAENMSAAESSDSIHPDTRIGHIHLQVSDLDRSAQFYTEILGFDVMQRSYPGALFVSAGGYHHHIGLNVWNSKGAGPPPPDTVGLASFDIVIPDVDERKHVLTNIQASSFSLSEATKRKSAYSTKDPDGIKINLR